MSSPILIVDDEPFMLRLIDASLKKGGFTAATCRSGESAIEWATQHPPQLIIIDLMMPGLDGLATLQVMRQTTALADVPIIMLTAKGHLLAQVEATRIGVEVFLTKPFSPSQLLDEVKRLLAAHTVS
ncbi:MAG TPA: response regulator [Chthoniobacter sp.]|jgi:DNA-binding response OmpR family regulator